MRRIRAWGPGLVLILPSLIALAVFVYGFLGWNIRVSLSSWRGLAPAHDFVGLRNYIALFSDQRFTEFDVPNIAIFTLVFVAGSLAIGFVMALLLDRGVTGENAFRSVYLFPMAISFIATAIIWRWLMDNGSGESETGINKLLAGAGLGALHSDWFKSGSRWAIAAIALPAGWSLSGYVMSLFLAGMRGVPEELREAARVDGASEPRVFWHVVRPMLLPVMMSAVVILTHISLKTFDLFYAMDQKNIKIDTPALYMWFTTFDGGFYARGAAIATLLLLGVATVIVPYIWYSVRVERRR
ncbi:MAG: sugar ABC transporter permease [Deltaproteobacteria bacterium]|nr:MAG: sugar ABC transporter permease [Deltaproteobacteria bacterium]TMQ12491.1 MAG: sugar ABC transporter permease [Deltaproteobacteria bacterium]